MFRTEPVVILTSGATIDGRDIKKETVLSIAKTYDPSVYNAIINIEHDQNSTKLGSVLELSTQQKGDQVQLLAVLKPNDYLLYMIERGQKVHTSCEIIMNFAKTGNPYLVGLAVTDTPASLGTSELHLSKDGSDVEVFSTQETIEKKKPNFLESFFTQKNKEEDMMDKAVMEVLSQVAETQKQLLASVEGLTTSLSALVKTDKVTANAETEGKKDESAVDTESKTELAAMQEEITKLSGALEKSNETIASLTQNLSQFTDEQERHQATGTDTNENKLSPENIL